MRQSSIINLVCNNKIDITLPRRMKEFDIRCSLSRNVLDNSQLSIAVHGVDSGVCFVPSFASMIGNCQVNLVSDNQRVPGHSSISSNGLK